MSLPGRPGPLVDHVVAGQLREDPAAVEHDGVPVLGGEPPRRCRLVELLERGKVEHDPGRADASDLAKVGQRHEVWRVDEDPVRVDQVA